MLASSLNDTFIILRKMRSWTFSMDIWYACQQRMFLASSKSDRERGSFEDCPWCVYRLYMSLHQRLLTPPPCQVRLPWCDNERDIPKTFELFLRGEPGSIRMQILKENRWAQGWGRQRRTIIRMMAWVPKCSHQSAYLQLPIPSANYCPSNICASIRHWRWTTCFYAYLPRANKIPDVLLGATRY